jgi:lipoprotein-releasing system ATP-binding protein
VAPEGAPLLAADGVAKGFGSGAARIEVFRNVSLAVRAGDLLAITGPSGCGKSTLLHLFAGLDAPDAGTVVVDGTDWSALGAEARASVRGTTIGFVFQFHHLLPEFSAVENVAMPLLIGRRPVEAARRRALELLDEVGLRDRADHRPGALSGGEQQRVAVARALAASPRVLLADEPTGDLDRGTGQKLAETLRSLVRARGLTVVIVTHNEALARGCDRVLALTGGRLLAA